MKYGTGPYCLQGYEIIPPKWAVWVELTMSEALEQGIERLAVWWGYFREVAPEADVRLVFASDGNRVSVYLVCSHFVCEYADEIAHIISLVNALSDIFGGQVPAIKVLSAYDWLLVCEVPDADLTSFPPLVASKLLELLEERKRVWRSHGQATPPDPGAQIEG